MPGDDDLMRQRELMMRQMHIEMVGMRGQLMTLTEILMRIERSAEELTKVIRDGK